MCKGYPSVTRIKTEGSSYFFATLPYIDEIEVEQSIEQALLCAFSIVDAGNAWAGKSGALVTLSIGVHHGPVVSGVVGASKLAYDIFGPTADTTYNIARLAPADCVLASNVVYEGLKRNRLFKFVPNNKNAHYGASDVAEKPSSSGVRAQLHHRNTSHDGGTPSRKISSASLITVDTRYPVTTDCYSSDSSSDDVHTAQNEAIESYVGSAIISKYIMGAAGVADGVDSGDIELVEHNNEPNEEVVSTYLVSRTPPIV